MRRRTLPWLFWFFLFQVQKYYGRHDVHETVAGTMAEAEYLKGSTSSFHHVCQLERKVSYTTCNLGSD